MEGATGKVHGFLALRKGITVMPQGQGVGELDAEGHARSTSNSLQLSHQINGLGQREILGKGPLIGFQV